MIFCSHNIIFFVFYIFLHQNPPFYVPLYDLEETEKGVLACTPLIRC